MTGMSNESNGSLITIGEFSNGSSNSLVSEKGAISTSIVLGVFCVFAILFNSLLIYCIVVNRKEAWAKQSNQIFYLILSDLVVGLILVPRTIFTLLYLPQKTYQFCAVLNYILVSSQTVSYYHIFAVCFHRYRMVRKMHRPFDKDAYRYSIESAFIWIIVLVACVPPYVFWGRHGEILRICRLDHLFRPSDNMALIYLLILQFIPWVLTNIIYLTISRKMCISLNAVHATTNINLSYSNDRISCSNGRDRTFVQTICVSATQASSTVTIVPNFSRIRNKKVLRTVGYLLLVFNISILSIMLTFILILSTPGISVPGQFQSLVFVNNICNPFIYAFSYSSLRGKMKRVILGVFSRLRDSILCKS